MAHNIVYYDTATTTITKMTTADVDALASYVLEYMVGLGASSTGHLSTTSSGINTLIGTIVDSYRNAPGSSDITLFTTNYNIYQNQAQVQNLYSPNMVGLDTSGSPTIVLQSNLMTQNDLADEIITRMISGTYGGIGSYWLSTTAPVDGGTWVSQATITNTTGDGTTTTYYLWRKTNNGSTTSITKRPLKLNSGELAALTTTDIQRISGYVESRMVATGKGMYSVATSVPGTGTWVDCGAVIDSTQTTQDVSFTGTTGAVYTGIPPIFSGSVSYQATFTGTADFAGVDPDGWGFSGVTFFSGTVYYTSQGTVTYVGPAYIGAKYSFSGSFVGYPTQYFARNMTYQGTGPAYLGPYPTFYVGPSSSTINFTGFVPYTSTASTFLGYDGSTTEFYTGAQVSPSQVNLLTYHLWRRVA